MLLLHQYWCHHSGMQYVKHQRTSFYVRGHLISYLLRLFTTKYTAVGGKLGLPICARSLIKKKSAFK